MALTGLKLYVIQFTPQKDAYFNFVTVYADWLAHLVVSF